MKTVLALLLLVGHFCPAADRPAASSPGNSLNSPSNSLGTRYYVQLIRGGDEPKPPAPGATLVGPKIQKQLDPVFRWKYYWEIQRTDVAVEAGKTGKVDLLEGRSLVIDLRQPGKRAIHLYRGKNLVRTVVCSQVKEFCIQGTESTDGAPWFVVVRTDPPAT